MNKRSITIGQDDVLFNEALNMHNKATLVSDDTNNYYQHELCVDIFTNNKGFVQHAESSTCCYNEYGSCYSNNDYSEWTIEGIMWLNNNLN